MTLSPYLTVKTPLSNFYIFSTVLLLLRREGVRVLLLLRREGIRVLLSHILVDTPPQFWLFFHRLVNFPPRLWLMPRRWLISRLDVWLISCRVVDARWLISRPFDGTIIIDGVDFGRI